MKVILAGVVFLMGSSAFAGAEGQCFDFDQVITKPLREPLHQTGKKDAAASGKAEGGYWAAARGVVDRPILRLYEKLLDHTTIKDPKKVKLRVYDQPRPGYSAFHMVMLELSVLLLSINWEEDWGYVVTEGTANAPKQVVISYQKSEGTSYIRKLCGSIVLNSLGPSRTSVSLYEVIDATGKRSEKDIMKSHRGTLATLRNSTKLN